MSKSYPSYKDSKIEWVELIPEHWSLTKIKYSSNGSVNSFMDGDWIESPYITDKGIRYITTGNIGEGKFKKQGNSFISEKTFEKLNCAEVFSGDLIISRLSPPVGRCCIIPDLGFRIVTSVDNVILRPKKGIEKKYLVYLFNTHRYYEFTDLISRGTTLTRISRTMLGNIRFPLPPPQEQKQIVKYLDYKTQLINKLIEKTKKKIELFKEKRTALINHCVTKGLNPDVEMKDSGVEWVGKIPKHWKMVKLKYLTKKVGSGLTPRGGSNIYSDNGIPFLRSQNIHFDGLKLDDIVFISVKTHEQMSNSKVLPNDVLMNITGASIGRCFYTKLDSIEYNVNQHVCIIRPNEKIITKFLYYLLCSDLCQVQIPLNNTGSGKEGLNFQNIKNFILFKVDKKEQYQIVDYLDSQIQNINEIIEKENIRIELLKEYRKSLVSEVVTGKIDVRDEVTA